MRGKLSKRALKKYLRRRERMLDKHLRRFLKGFNSTKPLKEEKNHALLLKLRWLIQDFLYARLNLHTRWMRKNWFLDLLDVDEVKIRGAEVELACDIVWWMEGKDAAGSWWPSDHEPHRTAPYKVKIRGDLDGGYWILEPVRARLRTSKTPKHTAEYEIDFGTGSTYMKLCSKHWKKSFHS